MTEKFLEEIKKITDDELFELLDAVSNEVKRRNNLTIPPIADIRKQSVEQNVNTFIEALAGLGVKINNKTLLFCNALR